MKNMKKIYSVLSKAYLFLIAVLTIISLIFLIADLTGAISLSDSPFLQIEIAIWLIYVLDYLVRLIQAKDKRQFLKKNLLDLFAIIPVYPITLVLKNFKMFQLLKTADFLKIIRFLRIGIFLKLISQRTGKFLHTNGFIYILYGNIGIILISSIIMSYTENMSFLDALWWSFVTCATVGYGDISPKSTGGRIIAVILMLFGISSLGMLTGTITTYFTQKYHKKNVPHSELKQDDELTALLNQATPEEKQKILEIAKILLKK